MDIKIYLENNHSCRGSFELKQIRFEWLGKYMWATFLFNKQSQQMAMQLVKERR